MAEWWRSPSLQQPYEPYAFDPYYLEKPPLPVPPALPPQAQHSLPLQQHPPAAMPPPPMVYMPPPKPDNPREIRNKAEKQRRDKLNKSIAELASMVPPVVYSARKIDKTGVLRYTAHYLRAHQYVFNPPTETSESPSRFTVSSTRAILSLLNGFLLTTTYKGLIVVVSQNINEYLGYNELELLGKSIYGLVHQGDHELLRKQLLPKSQPLGNHGELLVPNDQEGRQKAAEVLSNEKRQFVIRFLKNSQRSEPSKYVICHVEGFFRMADHTLRGNKNCCQIVRRARARGENPCSSGNDVVFVGLVRPCTETYISESALESFRLEYRTRHSIDGEIIQSEQRIALVTGYMIEEVSGVNAMNFIHRDEVNWVIIALKEMYNQNKVYGESCYRLMTKNGQFIYLRTRGRLDVDSSSKAVTSFVCTNTEVDEKEGKQLIKMMKERYTVQAKYQGHLPDDTKERSDSQSVEDPRQLETAILNMVTGLPSADKINYPTACPSRGQSPQRLNIIAPKTERIVSAIEKIYTVLNIKPKNAEVEENLMSEIEKNQPVPTVYEETPSTSYEETVVAMTPPYLDASNLPPYDMFFQAQGPAAELSETYSTFPDFTSTMAYSHNEMSFVNEVGIIQPDMELELLSSALNEYDGMTTNVLCGLNNNNSGGVKRPRCEDQGETSNKKTAVKTDATNEKGAARNTSTLETFFDEEILLSHIKSAMESLDDFVDPNFADYLTSGGIEDILGTNHNDSNEK